MLIRLMMLTLVLVLAGSLFAQTNPTLANPGQANSTQANAASGQQDGPSDLDRCQIITTADLSDPKAPTFEDYPAATETTVRKAKLDLASNPIAKTYRTVLRQEMVQGPNYAGHYRAAIWGCGSSCAMFAVVNLKTGRVITPAGITRVSGVHLGADDFLSHTKNDSSRFRYRHDSKLLVLVGTLDENDSRQGAFYFLLKRERLIRIHSTVVKKNCKEAQP